MVVLESNLWFLTYQVAYYPAPDSLNFLLSSIRHNTLLRVRQTTIDLARHPLLLQRSPFYTIYVDLSQGPDRIFKNFNENCRNKIRRVERLSGSVEIRQNDVKVVQDFVALYNELARLKGHSGPITQSTVTKLLTHGELFVAYLDEKPLCGHLCLKDETEKRIRLVFSCSTRLRGKDDATISSWLNRYTHWYEFRKYCAEGFEIYDFGGFEEEADRENSLTRFKLSFGASIMQENNYTFGTGLVSLIFKFCLKFPQLRTLLRGRLPA